MELQTTSLRSSDRPPFLAFEYLPVNKALAEIEIEQAAEGKPAGMQRRVAFVRTSCVRRRR